MAGCHCTLPAHFGPYRPLRGPIRLSLHGDISQATIARADSYRKTDHESRSPLGLVRDARRCSCSWQPAGEPLGRRRTIDGRLCWYAVVFRHGWRGASWWRRQGRSARDGRPRRRKLVDGLHGLRRGLLRRVRMHRMGRVRMPGPPMWRRLRRLPPVHVQLCWRRRLRGHMRGDAQGRRGRADRHRPVRPLRRRPLLRFALRGRRPAHLLPLTSA
jgi:hypothetical protein